MGEEWCKDYEKCLQDRDKKWEELVHQREKVISEREKFILTAAGQKEDGGGMAIQLRSGEQANSASVKRLVWGMWKTACRYSDV
jgi:uncharacterized protein YecA (UPF0149 family)